MPQQVLPPSESWRLIDAWLATHVASDFALLNPPAPLDEIRKAERILGAPLPDDLAESLQCHNGVSAWTTILPEQSPLPVGGVVDRWQTCMGVAAENEGLSVRPWEEEPWWHRLWVPWAESADGVAQVIDHVLVLTRGVSAGRATAVAVTSPNPGLIWRAFSTRSRKHFMKEEMSTGYAPTSPRKAGCGGTRRAATSRTVTR
ncbi:SMI1/KNR4 family protein [Streptomyces microflavus]|uniref:SMI1/KNR4 family protein n=1 Tax=Streptomyces microflavus TaxID=1919 RepID=UPI0033A8A577